MPKVTYIEASGKKHEIQVDTGLSIMEGAVQNSVPGIDADCGGSCACATCHVYVDEQWTEPKKNSRLSCQLILEDSHDGIIVNLPSKQG